MDLYAVQELVGADRAALDGWRAGDAWLAGGTWLFSEPQPRVRRLLDLRAFGWPALTASDAGLEIAATCTLAELAAWPRDEAWPATRLIGECCRSLLGSFKVANAATVGGNLCLALPAGPMVSLAVALDGELRVWEPGDHVRVIPARQFVTGPGEAAIGPGALVRSLLLPAAALRGETAFRRHSLSPQGRSAVMVTGRRDPESGELVVAVTASVSRPVVLRFDHPPSADELAEALDEAEPSYYDDPHGDPVWREHLTRMYAEEVRGELAGARCA
jgi:CO/xanthine dehydrogenase FAD-binding subunit